LRGKIAVLMKMRRIMEEARREALTATTSAKVALNIANKAKTAAEAAKQQTL